jgi:hypothetical protein
MNLQTPFGPFSCIPHHAEGGFRFFKIHLFMLNFQLQTSQLESKRQKAATTASI